MPLDFVKMHRSANIDSRLVTMYRNTLNFEEDICLSLNLPKGSIAKKWRDSKVETLPHNTRRISTPKNLFEKMFFKLRDYKNSPVIKSAIDQYGLYDFDIYHFDGGMDFYRDIRFAKELKRRGKKIVCCYYGSDLRTRGIFPELDKISDLNLTVEYDHLNLHQKINYIFFPFDTESYETKPKNNSGIKIIHSPTNRKFKGTDRILKVIAEVEKIRRIEFILLENMDRHEVLKIKSNCDLAIDQVGGEMGGSGYGRNSIENLSMGVPTFTEFDPDYLLFLKDHPFINSTIDTLKDNIIKVIDSDELRRALSIKGRKWVEEHHSYKAVNHLLTSYYLQNNILADG
jgi:glycosyltransferase involved in cell wall biosynthesis